MPRVTVQAGAQSLGSKLSMSADRGRERTMKRGTLLLKALES